MITLSPTALARIKVGDFLLAVDGKNTAAGANLDELLEYKINRRVVLSVASDPNGAGKRDVAVRPVNTVTEKGLLYRQWVEHNRDYVSRISSGRLGYVHLSICRRTRSTSYFWIWMRRIIAAMVSLSTFAITMADS